MDSIVKIYQEGNASPCTPKVFLLEDCVMSMEKAYTKHCLLSLVFGPTPPMEVMKEGLKIVGLLWGW
eukprot:c13951_g2_i2 orf=329-529(-)